MGRVCDQQRALALLLAAEATLAQHAALLVRRHLRVQQLAHASRVVVLVRLVARVHRVVVGVCVVVARARTCTAIVAVVLVRDQCLTEFKRLTALSTT